MNVAPRVQDYLAGTWEITSFELSTVDGSHSVNFVFDLGWSLTLAITADGAFDLSLTLAGRTEIDRGVLTVNGADITLDFDGGDDLVGTISRSGDTVTIEVTSGVEFDFDGDGREDPAVGRIVMVKE